MSSPGRGPERFLTASSDARVYYSIRNLVYFETTRWSGSKALYEVNKAIVLTLILAAAVKNRRLSRLRLMAAAVRDGECGKLGRTLSLEEGL